MTKEERAAEYRKKHFGECAVANCGMKMFIIAYRNNDDIDVVFQDGTIVKNKRYKNFTKGKIANPNIGMGLKVYDRIGELQTAKNGLKMIIQAYRNASDIDILFEDGILVKNRKYCDFQTRCIKNSRIYKNFVNNRIGEIVVTKSGQKMTIIAYRSAEDIDVQFEDGTVIFNKPYGSFVRGKIRNPNFVPPSKTIKTRIGEKNIARNGQKMTIIAYRRSDDIDVQFEDGTIIEHKSYTHFIDGSIGNPNCKVQRKSSKSPKYKNTENTNCEYNKTKQHIDNKIGETSIATNGQIMTLIAYRNYTDVDIQFEDGIILRNKRYGDFKRGEIGNPNTPKNLASIRLGEITTAANGQKMTIIAYRKGKDIDVQFEDGTIVKNKMYKDFVLGNIGNPNYANKTAHTEFVNTKIGETAIANNGQTMTIIAYKSYQNIDVQFEDGIIVQKQNYDSFIQGRITNPEKKILRSHSFNELTILYYLKQYGFVFGSKHILQSAHLGNREIDIYHPDLKIGIEYDGYRHTNQKDLKKNELCAKAGITLIRIRESYNTKLSDNLSINFHLTDNKPLSANFNQVLIDVCNYINSISKLNIDTKTIDFNKDKFLIYDEIYQNVLIKKLGEAKIARNGQKMTIIAYRNCNDIDIQFEDGTIIKNRRYCDFAKGCIGNPTIELQRKQSHVGEVMMTTKGHLMTIIKYVNYNNVDVMFDDGSIYEHVCYDTFKNGWKPSSKKLK